MGCGLSRRGVTGADDVTGGPAINFARRHVASIARRRGRAFLIAISLSKTQSIASLCAAAERPEQRQTPVAFRVFSFACKNAASSLSRALEVEHCPKHDRC